MIRLTSAPVILTDGQRVRTLPDVQAETGLGIESLKALRNHTIAYQILRAHDSSEIPGKLRIRFDSITSHDITYVGIIQSAIASGLDRFPIPYVLTNCHNSLCAVGGTINADDHAFGLSAARRFGGVYVPPNLAVIHQFEREMMRGCGRMILGSDRNRRQKNSTRQGLFAKTVLSLSQPTKSYHLRGAKKNYAIQTAKNRG